MRLETSLHHRQELQLRLAPQLIQSIEILQLPAMDLQDLIDQQLMENEVLEVKEGPGVEVPEDGAPPGEEAPPATQETEQQKAEKEEDDRIDQIFEESYEDESWAPRSSRVDDPEKDRKNEAMQNTASKPISLQDYLQQQLMLAEVDVTLKEIAEHIIYNIDDHGYLPYPLEDIVASLDGRFTLEQIQAGLKVVQALEPKGVAGRDIKECLLLQLSLDDPDYPLLKRMIENHLEDIYKNRIPKIAKETGESIETINLLIEKIRRLNIRPGSAFSSDVVHYVRPDVIVELVDGNYEIRLEDDFYPRLRISPKYRTMYENKTLDPKVREYIKRKIDSAKWLIDAIEQRQSTLLRVCRALITHQRDFLDFGIHHLHPLKMQQIADELGIHVSTVSRAISEKYIQTHRGIFPMKFFFTGGTQTNEGPAESRVSVKQWVQEIIEKEDKNSPLSDEEVAEKLQQMGLDIARRTVTKYRKALKIPSSRQRRRY